MWNFIQLFESGKFCNLRMRLPCKKQKLFTQLTVKKYKRKSKIIMTFIITLSNLKILYHSKGTDGKLLLHFISMIGHA